MPEEDGWLVAVVRCLECLGKHVSVMPVGTDENALECPKCHGCDSMLEEPIEIEV